MIARAIATSVAVACFTVGLYATCPSMPGMVAGLQHSGPTREPIPRRAASRRARFCLLYTSDAADE